MNIFIYYAYLTPFSKCWNVSCDKNASHAYQPEMTINANDSDSPGNLWFNWKQIATVLILPQCNSMMYLK